MHNRLTADSGKPPAEHIVLTDGLATVSVFLEPLGGAKPLLEGPAQMGAMNAFGKVSSDYQVLVVGEVPQATVQMIASALHTAPGAAAK
jgi:sigma-E factor negative regulatory protein RseB